VLVHVALLGHAALLVHVLTLAHVVLLVVASIFGSAALVTVRRA
jgi:hypothetical protein